MWIVRLVEVHLPNRDHALVPGMYAQMRLTPAHPPTTLRISGTALVVDARGTRVASVTPEGRVHYVPVQVGTDFGTEVAIVGGLRGDETLVAEELPREKARMRRRMECWEA